MKPPKYGQNVVFKQFGLYPFSLLSVMLLSSFHVNFTTEPNVKRNADKFTVVLDAGHGGHDPGNLGNGYKEKNIALNIVLKAGALLEKNPNIKVIYTRKDDTFVDLYVRGEIANKAGADLFVSVHCDSHTSKAHGAGTFVLGLHANKQNFEIAKKENSVIYLEDDYKSRYADYDINSPESVIGLTIMQEEFLDQSVALAKAIQDNFSNKLHRVDRKVKQAGFIVLHQTFMPSVLVETGFLTNDAEGAYLNSKKGQEQMGTAIAEAVLNYKNDAMANIADFNSVAVTEVSEPKEKVEDRKTNQDAKRELKNKNLSQKGIDENANIKSAKETAAILKNEENKSRTIQATNSEVDQPGKISMGDESSQPVTKSTSETEKVMKDDNDTEIIYKVQLMASSKDFPLRPESFNGLSKVAKEPIKNLYRYVYGSTSSLEEAKMLKSNADMKGYPTSFIVVYRNGERTTFKESKKYISDQ